MKHLPFDIDRSCYEPTYKKNSSIHIAGLGDVGGTFLTGLRLLGGDTVSRLGIFDLDQNKLQRWKMEAGQIFIPYGPQFPEVEILEESRLFQCDVFAFCVTAGVPPMDFQGDVRMFQLEKNMRILQHYVEKAVKANFQGLFAVISDPVDQLCLGALQHSDHLKDEAHPGLSPLQIRGYGLGVMYARALYYAKEQGFGPSFLEYGRAYGPHGQGLVIADSVSEYDHDRSLALTEMTRTANMRVRETGFKPFIAPAFSSACLSLLATITGQWHYSAIYLDGAYLGIKNRTGPSGTEYENIPLDPKLHQRIMAIHEELKSFSL